MMGCKNKMKPRGVLSNFWASPLYIIMYLMIISSALFSLCRRRCG